MKAFALIAVLLCGALLVYGTADFPPWGSSDSPAARHLSPHFIEKSIEETSVPNVVTAVLADYRGYDTMFETAVVFTAGIACLALLRLFSRRRPDEVQYRHLATGVVVTVRGGKTGPTRSRYFERIDSEWTPHDLIIKTACRLLIPFIQLFALYVIAHGHYSPGGGFQGGVILGASVILIAVSRDLRTANRAVPEKGTNLLSAAGVLVYAGVGAVCLGFGFNFLDYAGLAGVLMTDPISARSLGILFVELGVGAAVMATMILIYANLVSAGRYDEGL